jgi:hypothetical protein
LFSQASSAGVARWPIKEKIMLRTFLKFFNYGKEKSSIPARSVARSSIRPGVEMLERREMMDGSLAFSLQDGILSITGTQGDDTIRFRQIENRLTLEGTSGSWNSEDIHLIKVDAGSGCDIVDLNSGKVQGEEPIQIPAEIHGGAGNDILRGGAANDLLLDGTGADLFLPSGGQDTFQDQAGTGWIAPDGTALRVQNGALFIHISGTPWSEWNSIATSIQSYAFAKDGSFLIFQNGALSVHTPDMPWGSWKANIATSIQAHTFANDGSLLIFQNGALSVHTPDMPWGSWMANIATSI